ncbi:hypothetical protein [Saliterribacillus persicus]|uniref:DUF4083 domain-containing protein n=1 Tax=Saliterribacillus persicus TaxID=930114 RepID=A0A368YB96_9BACI|nr:hypothetical protein [Saliterribacillus persicus]RCW77472.1 hypothetical protein DFR57_101346 [Saliterribacillus persicus]
MELIFAEVGGFRAGDMFFALFSFTIMFLITTVIIYLYRRNSQTKARLKRVEEKVDALLERDKS